MFADIDVLFLLPTGASKLRQMGEAPPTRSSSSSRVVVDAVATLPVADTHSNECSCSISYVEWWQAPQSAVCAGSF